MSLLIEARRRALSPLGNNGMSGLRTLAAAAYRAAPLLAIGIGLAVVFASTPIGSGDYGQWLMASRYYLGEQLPDYRSIDVLPPVIPFSLAVLRLVISDPFAALHIFGVLLLLGVVASVYAAAAAIFTSRAAGILAVVLAFLVTDRFLELFAFGGLLQAGALMFMTLSVAAFVRAGAGPGVQRVWWSLGSVSLVLAALSHVGTGVLAVPVALSAAALSLLRARRIGLARLLPALVPVGLILVFLVLYWLVVLLPAGEGYVTNPASLNYRGAGRLFEGLFSYWPTVVIIVVGSITIVAGAIGDLMRRVLGRYVLLLCWSGAVWGALLFAIVTNASTDYPRFSTPLMTPLVLGAAAGLHASVSFLARFLDGVRWGIRRSEWVLISVMALALTAAPFAVQRYQTEARGYELHNATALATVASRFATELGPYDAVLAPVREAKWIEGLTGRTTLFSQAVRYAFRPGEWERSIAAEALLRSTSAMSNEFFFIKYQDLAAGHGVAVPRNAVIAANHGGEFVDLLRISEYDTRVLASDPTRSTLATLVNLQPHAVSRKATAQQVAIQTTWIGERRGGQVSVTQDATLTRNAPTFDLTLDAQTPVPVGGLQLDLRSAPGIGMTSVEIVGQQATVYFSRRGLEQPGLRIKVVDGAGAITQLEPDTLQVEASGSRLHLQVTVLTAGKPFSSLQMLYPPDLVKQYHIGAVLLDQADPAFASRERRLEAIGFHAEAGDGPYGLMFR
jgi:hypothetical protein